MYDTTEIDTIDTICLDHLLTKHQQASSTNDHLTAKIVCESDVSFMDI